VHRLNIQHLRAHWLVPAVTAAAALIATGCSHHINVDPIEVKPIYLTVDVNVRLDQELRESFGFEDRIERQAESTTQPATAPAAAVPSTMGEGTTS